VWTYIDGVRRFVDEFCRATSEDEELAVRARLAVQEALENAVKYSLSGPSNELELTMSADASGLEIAVESTPDPSHLDALRQELTELYRSAPEAAYIAAFERAAHNPGASARLGLARIRYEGQMDLALLEMGDGRVRMSVKGKT
jgi:hypothetical protein